MFKTSVLAVPILLKPCRSALRIWLAVDAITPELSILVFRVREVLVTVVAIPLNTTWKQGRMVMMVDTMTAVNISAMARVFGVVLYPKVVNITENIGMGNGHTVRISSSSLVRHVDHHNANHSTSRVSS